MHVKCLVTSVVSNSFATSWTVTHEAPLFVGFSRQEYQSGLPFPFPGDLPNSGIEPTSPESPVLQADSLPVSHLGSVAQSIALYNQLHFTLEKNLKFLLCRVSLLESDGPRVITTSQSSFHFKYLTQGLGMTIFCVFET